MQPVPRDELSDRGGHARPNYLCYPSPHRRWETRVCTIFHVQPSAAMRGDEEGGTWVAAAVKQDGGGGGERARERERGRAARARINFPDPEFISSISAQLLTHHSRRPCIVLACCQTHPGFHLWPASPLHDGAHVLAAATSRPLLITAETFQRRFHLMMTRSCTSAPDIGALPSPLHHLPPFFPPFFFNPNPRSSQSEVQQRRGVAGCDR